MNKKSSNGSYRTRSRLKLAFPKTPNANTFSYRQQGRPDTITNTPPQDTSADTHFHSGLTKILPRSVEAALIVSIRNGQFQLRIREVTYVPPLTY